MRRYLGIFSLLLAGLSVYCQEATGLKIGDYNHTSKIFLNPSNAHNSPHKWEAQLFGAHAFLETGYGFIYNTHLIEVLSNTDQINIPAEQKPINEYQNLEMFFSNSPISNNNNISTTILGPAFQYKVSDQLSVGIGVRGRVEADAYNVPSSLNYYNIIELQTDSIFFMDAFQINGAAWQEYYLSASYQYDENVSIGGNIKFLKAIDAFSIDNNNTFDYVETAGDTLTSIQAGSFALRFSDGNDDSFNTNGGGWAADFGINFSSDNNRSSWGFSLLDLGWLNVLGSSNDITYEAGKSVIYTDYSTLRDEEDIIDRLAEDQFSIDSSQQFTMWLPTALSIQYSEQLSQNISVSAHWVQNLKLADNQLRRPNSIVLAGSYERKHFSVHAPISIFDYEDIRLGLAFRFMFLTIGSDHIQSIFDRREQFNGTDLYLRLNLYPFINKKKGSHKGSGVNCYDF